MAWENPITTWGQAGQTVPGVDDFNRIEGNIDILGKYDRAPGYGTATGTNTKAITLSPAPSSYYEGLCFAFKNSVENTGAVTINVNGLGAKSVKKPNGNNLVSGNLKAGSVYTVRYNGTNFILQGSDSSGDAMPEHVLAGKIFSNDSDTDITGTMPNRGSQTATLSITGASKPTKSISAGYVNTSTITAEIPSSQAHKIKKGETLGGCEGTLGSIKTIQHGIVKFSPSINSVNVTINSIDISKSIIMFNYTFTGEPSNLRDLLVKGTIVDSTTLIFQVARASYSPSIHWTVVEFDNVKSLQSGEFTWLVSESNKNIQINTVTPTKALIFYSSMYTWDSSASSYGYVSANFTSNTNINFKKSSTSGTGEMTTRWYVIEFV